MQEAAGNTGIRDWDVRRGSPRSCRSCRLLLYPRRPVGSSPPRGRGAQSQLTLTDMPCVPFRGSPPCFSRESWTSVQRKQAPSSLGFSPGSDRNAPGNTRITDRRCAFYCVTGVSPALRLARVPRSTRSRPTAGVPRAFRRRPDEGRRRNLRFPTRGYRRHLSLIARSFLIENGCRLMQPCY